MALRWQRQESENAPHKLTDADYGDDIVLLANTPTQTNLYNIVWNRQLVA